MRGTPLGGTPVAGRRARRQPGVAAVAMASAALAAAALALAGCGPAVRTTGPHALGPSAPPAQTPTESPGDTSTPGASGAPPAATSGPPSSPDASPTTAPNGSPTSSPTGVTATDPSLVKPGQSGPIVLAAQQQLADLGYWLGTPDGSYGGLTQQAVTALQKVAGLQPDGVLGPATTSALARGVRPAARGVGTGIEIDLKRQVLLIVRGGQVITVLNTSTGSGKSYTSEGASHVAVTPPGHFTFFRQVNGQDHSPLGELWRPKYFNGGIALHGYTSVPSYPASHGCVRISNPAMDWVWSSNQAPIGSAVWVY